MRDLLRESTRYDLMHGVHYSKKFNCIYIESPKCGCSSIKTLIQTYEHEGPNREHALDIRDLHNKSVNSRSLPGLKYSGVSGLCDREFIKVLSDQSIFKFSVVRNPYTRIVSAYNDKILKSLNEKVKVVSTLYPNMSELSKREKLERDVSFSDFLRFILSHKISSEMNVHWRPQHALLLYDYLNYDFIGKLEDADQSWKKIYNKVYANKRKFIPLMKKNITSKKAPTTALFYTDELANKVYDFYKNDFLAFGYERESYKWM